MVRVDRATAERSLIRRARLASEMIVLAIACLAPWAFGAVDAWAQFGLDLGIVLLALLAALIGRGSNRGRGLLCVPSLALAGLVLLALAQAVPLPGSLLRRAAPGTYALRAGLTPGVPERVRGEEAPPVAPPSTTVSQDPDATLGTAMQLAAAWVLFQAVLGSGGGPASFRRFGLATAANAALLALFAMVQSLTWSGKIYGIRPTLHTNGWMTGGPFVCHSHLAAYLNIGLGFALGLLLSSRPPGAGHRWGSRRDPGSRLWPACAAGLIVASVIASHSRGGFLAMTAAAAVMVFSLGRGFARLGNGLAAMLALVALFLVALGSISPFQRLATIADAGTSGLDGRVEIWRAALQAWRVHPLWGTGLGSFPASTAPYFEHDHGVFYSHSEDEYVQMLVEGGVVGLGLALLALVSIARLGLRARVAAASPPARTLILGGLFGGLALAVQSLSDFPLHIPGVAVTAVILCAHLCRLGLEARGTGSDPGSAAPRAIPAGLVQLAMIGLGLATSVHGFRLARAEARVAGAGLPLPGTRMPTADRGGFARDDLERMRATLERALRDRPDWAEGYLRLGGILLGLYEQTAREWIKGSQEVEPANQALLADYLWLHGVVHASGGDRRATADGLLEHEPIRRYLVPAARCFLEARRCCPVLALSHARLASLDYLLERGEPVRVHAGRALRLVGSDGRLIALIARVAFQAGEPDLAARCCRRALEVGGEDWAWIADTAGAGLQPEQILDQVLPPGGRYALRFADRLYSTPKDRAIRDRFLRTALARLPDEPGLGPAERLWLEAQARARLGERERARPQMEAALRSEPLRGDWREEFVDWLIAWGDPEEAHRQALNGTQLNPGHPGLRRALQATVEALARGRPGAPSPDRDIPSCY
ncbi:MAG: O-antigen ligase family protein [Singulisphaera sp.]|nr:O-antigen ligase family protein [Singulisphaera sp.]